MVSPTGSSASFDWCPGFDPTVPTGAGLVLLGFDNTNFESVNLGTARTFLCPEQNGLWAG